MSFNKISFMPKSKEVEQLVPMPKPTRHYIPEWWHSIPAFMNGKSPQFDQDGTPDTTVKMCVPFSDTLKFGYIQETWCDIKIEQSDGEIKYFFSSSPSPLEARQGTDLHKSMYEGYLSIEMAWQTQWVPKVPKGYSVMVGHPLNRTDLPFYTLSGIVDSDKFFHEASGSHPFFIKEGFEGIIPAGTPMYQVIPFKRDNWEAVAEEYDDTFATYAPRKIKRKFWGEYKNNFWSKKTFK